MNKKKLRCDGCGQVFLWPLPAIRPVSGKVAACPQCGSNALSELIPFADTKAEGRSEPGLLTEIGPGSNLFG